MNSANDRSAQPRRVFVQWVALVGPPLLWLGQFHARYVMSGWPKVTTAQRAMLIVALAALALIALCVPIALRQWRLADASPLDQFAGVPGRSRFMGVLGLSSCALFFLATVAQLLAQFFIAPGLS